MAARRLLAWALSLMLSRTATGTVDVSPWYGRTIYFLVVDRFAKDSGDSGPQCGIFNETSGVATSVTSGWCGGTIRGIIRKLDYIQEMGFDALWITPVVKQADWLDRSGCTSYDGYKATDWNKIDPHFGTEEDLLELGRMLRKRRMLFMMDTVANHGPDIWKLEQVQQMAAPFNDPDGAGFHQFGKKPGQTFLDYANGYLHDWPFPQPDIEDANGKVIGSCHWPGDFYCGWNETINAYSYALDTDINQSYPPAREYLKTWVHNMVNKYSLDGLRLDTAAQMSQEFLGEFQEAAGVYILGEIMVPTNLTYHASFQREGALTGATNMPIVYQWGNTDQAGAGFMGLTYGFQAKKSKHEDWENDVWDVWQPYKTTFARLRQSLETQMAICTDVHLLGNFVDSHDTNRFLYKHHGDKKMLMNALVFIFMYHGLPIFYQGTDDPIVSGSSSQRASMWYETQLGHSYPTGDLYQFTAALNKLRRDHGFGHGGKHVKSLAQIYYADELAMVFGRGEVLVAVCNGKNNSSPHICVNTSVLPAAIQKACMGFGVSTIFGKDIDDPRCHEFPTPQLCFTMLRSSHAIFAPRPRPGAANPPRDAAVFAVAGALILTVASLGFFVASGKRKHKPLEEEDDDDEDSDE